MKTKNKLFFTMVFLFFVQVVMAQQKKITGVVTDSNGGTLPGVNVLIKGSQKSTYTDITGAFILNAAVGETLQFSYIGFKTKFIEIDTRTVYNVKLSEEVTKIEEVVVVGYGVQKKKEVTSAISKIKGSDIQTLVTPSFESQLAGRATGVQVTSATGIIGSAPKVRIRGVASISSSTDPLYVVDGVPLYTGDTGGYAVTNGLGDINPSDIESFEVLKDGAATAIYGSRAANGVILITTKKGKKDSTNISYSSVVGFASATKKFDLLKTQDFLIIANEKRTNRGQPKWAVGDQYDTDWQSEVLREGAMQIDHNLSLSGGGSKTKYYISLGYTKQDGVAKSNEMDRYTFRTNIEHELNKWLSFGGNIALTNTKYKGLNTGRGSLSGNIFNAIRQAPNTSPFDSANITGYNLNLATGNMGQGTNLAPLGDNITNISYVLANNILESKIQRTLLTVFTSANITKDLNYKFQISSDNPINAGFLYWNPTHGDGRGTNGRLQNNNENRLRWNVQNILSYNKTFIENHTISATVVAEYQKERNQRFFGNGLNLLADFYNQNLVTGAYETQESGGGITEGSIISYIGRASYNYKQKYFIQGSIRRDGLSKFAPDKRWNNFSGVSAGWNIAKEGFMTGISDIVSDFKIRGSYSGVGNTEIGYTDLGNSTDNAGTYAYLNLASPSQYGSLNGLAFTQYANPKLTWETSDKIDYGIDVALFNNKIKLTFDYFKNDISGLVLQVPIAPSLGIPSNQVLRNIGKLNNKGYEFGIEYTLINNKNLKWDVNTNLTLQSNKVTELPNNGADIVGGSSTDININPNLIIREGESINSLYGFQYWGVNPANGFPVYYKANGLLVQGIISNGTNNTTYAIFDPNTPNDISKSATLTTDDKKILGNTLPKYFGAFNSRFSYKNLDLGFLVRFSGGNKIFNSTRRDLMNQNFNNNSTEILGRWQSPSNPGDGQTPILWAGSSVFLNQTSNATTRFVEDGDFISLDNISLGYKLPKLITEKIKVDMIRFFVQAQNMAIITKYKGLNPEMETSGVDLNGTPRAKVLSMGININL
jgi:TonB-dependent starch-binding outer membrane protein SusC